MYGYEATVLLMVGKAMDAEKLALAQRERILTAEAPKRRTRRGN